MAEVEGASVLDHIITVLGEGLPAEIEEAAPGDHQLSLAVENALVDQLPGPHKTVFRAGLSMALISILVIQNPPISAVNTIHATVLSRIFHFLVFFSLAIGAVLMLLSTLLHRKPRWTVIANSLKKIGWASVKITLGYGSALVLMLSSPLWFALCLLLLYIYLK